MSELRVVVDHNKIQSDTLVKEVSDLGDLEAKFAAFGWNVARCDGHDLAALEGAFAALDQRGAPGVVIADTIKGKGVSFMEGLAPGDDLYHFHSGAPDLATYRRALDELAGRVNAVLAMHGGALRLEETPIVLPAPPSSPQRLVTAYSEALLNLARRDERVVALDGDLVLDTGLLPFTKEFPDRFLECGIAEQDMVGQAGGLALAGMLPIVHSFSCFLTTRPAEQIGTNASEGTKILYVGSLSGILPGGPGHSHQSVRDVALMASVPGMVIAEPCLDEEVTPLLAYLAGDAVTSSGYLRLVTVPVEVPFSLPENYVPRRGLGWTVRKGADLVVFGAGPVALSSLYRAAQVLAAEHGLSISLIAMPWLNEVDPEWFAGVLEGHSQVVTVENHLVVGGLGASIRAALDAFPGHAFTAIGLTSFPVCGQNDEVLAHHGLDPASLADALLRIHKGER
jgi:transketolase